MQNCRLLDKTMELLELEMRARAIKSLLVRTKGGDSTEAATPEPEEPKAAVETKK